MSQTLQIYQEKKSELQKRLGKTNLMAVPRLLKIVANVGLGEALVNKKAIDTVASEIAMITGQIAATTYAKKDVSAFKLRRGDAIGVKTTLRGTRMYDFFDKFVTIVLPRIRDFRGIDRDSGFDGRGSFTIGLSEQVVFPEIEYSKIEKIRGLEITFVTGAKNREETESLLEVLGMPFKKQKINPKH